jgi:hypothetical protein
MLIVSPPYVFATQPLPLRKKPDSCKMDKCGTVFGGDTSPTDCLPSCSARLRRKQLLSVEFSSPFGRLSAQLTTVSRQKLCR